MVKVHAIAAVLLAAIAACDDSDDTNGSGAPDASADATNADARIVRLRDIEQNIFATNCVFSVCHGSDAPQRGMSLVAPTYPSLVGIPAQQLASKLRVSAGSPEQSYLLEKVESSSPTSGKRMPPDQPLAPADIAMIRTWIEQGAHDN